MHESSKLSSDDHGCEPKIVPTCQPYMEKMQQTENICLPELFKILEMHASVDC